MNKEENLSRVKHLNTELERVAIAALRDLVRSDASASTFLRLFRKDLRERYSRGFLFGTLVTNIAWILLSIWMHK